MKSLSVTIQRKATEQYFTVVLFIMLHKVFFTFLLSLWMKSSVLPVQMKTTDDFFVVISVAILVRAGFINFKG